MAFNIAYLARESASAYPDKPALIFDGGALTFSEVDALSDQVAAGLHTLGFVRGDRIGLQLPNIPQFVIAYKYSRIVEVRSEMEHGSTGKILKTELR